MLRVFPSDPLRYRHGFWALVDPYRLPGITTNTWQLPDHDGGGFSPAKPSKQEFVGGASLDDLASVATMRVGREYSSLEARKGWFFLPDAIVCLGSGITAKDNRPCETIVENCRLECEDLPMLVDDKTVTPGDWKAPINDATTLHLAGTTPERAMGWWFPSSSVSNKSLAVEQGKRTGSWRDVIKNGSEAKITQPWLSIILSHGTGPQNASYQYVIFPGISADRLTAFAAKPTIEILVNTPQAQVVRDTVHGITSAIFYEPGSAGPFKVNQPCLVLLRESKEIVQMENLAYATNPIMTATDSVTALEYLCANGMTNEMTLST